MEKYPRVESGMDFSPVFQEELKNVNRQGDSLRKSFKQMIGKSGVGGDSNDTNYIFLRFVIDFLPKGLVGLLIAVIFLASWGSIAAALNSLASASVVDFHKKFVNPSMTESQDYRIAKIYTLLWGILCIVVAMFAYNIGNSLIEAVNKLGSLFYGVVLGVFLVAFFFKKIRGNAVFWSDIL